MKTLSKYLSSSGIDFGTEWMVEILEKSIETFGMERSGIDLSILKVTKQKGDNDVEIKFLVSLDDFEFFLWVYFGSGLMNMTKMEMRRNEED